MTHIDDLGHPDMVVGKVLIDYSGPRFYNYYLYIHFSNSNIAKKAGMDIQITGDKNITINITLIPQDNGS